VGSGWPSRTLAALDPTGGSPFTVELGAGRWHVEWYDLQRRVATDADPVQVADAGPLPFSAPFDGPAVLYLKV